MSYSKKLSALRMYRKNGKTSKKMDTEIKNKIPRLFDLSMKSYEPVNSDLNSEFFSSKLFKFDKSRPIMDKYLKSDARLRTNAIPEFFNQRQNVTSQGKRNAFNLFSDDDNI